MTYDRILKISSVDVTTIRNANLSLINTVNLTYTTAGTPGAVIGTTWNTADIWLRRTFNPGSLTASQISNLVFRPHHDEGAELYINGVLAASVTGYTSGYEYTR